MADVKVKIGADSSEFKRVMGGVRSDINGVRNMIGGLVAAGASIYGLTKAFQGLGLALKESSMEAAGIESLTMQFETLLGSADAAKSRMEEIAKFAASTPFEIKELAATSKLLQNLGGNIMATGDGLRMVGDAAAISGQPLQEVALHIGRVFNALTSGTSAGESVNRLQEIGLLSGVAKKKFEELAAAQKKGVVPSLKAADAMRILQGEFAKTAGAMERLAATTEGKLSNLQDNISQIKVAFGTGLNEGLKTGLDVINGEIPKFTEAFSAIGKTFGTAISEAIAGDTARLEQIGNFIATVVSESAKVGISRAFIDIGQASAKLMEDINPLRAIPGLREMERGSEYVGAGKQDFTASQISEAVEAARQSWAATQPTVIGYTPPTMDQIEAGREAVFRATMERQNQLLEEIRKNTAGKPFPN